MDKRLKGRKVVGILLFRTNPEIDFHASWVCFAARQRACDRVVDLMCLGITRAFHDHEVCVMVFVEYLIILIHRCSAPATQV